MPREPEVSKTEVVEAVITHVSARGAARDRQVDESTIRAHLRSLDVRRRVWVSERMIPVIEADLRARARAADIAETERFLGIKPRNAGIDPNECRACHKPDGRQLAAGYDEATDAPIHPQTVNVGADGLCGNCRELLVAGVLVLDE